MSDTVPLKFWVKEAIEGGTVFKVSFSTPPDVDDLKDAIKIKMEYTFGAPLLNIKRNDGTDESRAGRPVSGLITGENSEDNPSNSEDYPIYFSQPAPPGKFIMSLSYILCLYFAVTVLYIFMLF